MATNRDRIIHTILFTPTSKGWGLPVLFKAGPGVGKTDIIETVSDLTGLPLECLSPGERGEGAFGVTPVPSKGGQYMTYPPPDWTKKFTDGGIVFLDELTTAPPAIQPALLGLALSRRIGGSYLGSRVRIIAACNPPDQAANGWDLAPPLANRFGHMDWLEPTVEEWTEYMLGQVGKEVEQQLDADIEEARVMQEWAKPWATARGLVTGFLRAAPHLINKCPDVDDPQASGAWPSHRTWEFATRALAGANVHGLSESESDELMSAFVGAAAISEFVSYRAKADLPQPDEVLDGKVRWEHDPQRLDRTYAVLNSCAAFVTSPNIGKVDDRARQLWVMLNQVAEDSVDLAWNPARALAKAKLSKFKEASELMKRLFPIGAALDGSH